MGLAGLKLHNYFLYNNQPLLYNKFPYANCSERTIEIPIALQFLQQSGAGMQAPYLEIGNVLTYYKALLDPHPGLSNRIVVDKFEESPGVLNVDLMDYETKHSLILCLSTVEHIGQHAYGEEKSGDREAPLRAIQKIYNLIVPDGKALISLPFGKLMDCNWLINFSAEYLDLLFTRYGIPREAASIAYFRKQDMDMHLACPSQAWIQSDPQELSETMYDSPFAFANGIAILELHKIGQDAVTNSHSVRDSALQYAPAATIGNLYFAPFIRPNGFDVNGFLPATNSGYVFYGPLMELGARAYRLQATIELSGTGMFTIEATADQGKKLLWSRSIAQSTTIDAELSLPYEEKNVEFRLYKHNKSTCHVKVPMFLFTEK
jgi:hypothetical protein